jgi:hypothetical protein
MSIPFKQDDDEELSFLERVKKRMRVTPLSSKSPSKQAYQVAEASQKSGKSFLSGLYRTASTIQITSQVQVDFHFRNSDWFSLVLPKSPSS